MKKSQKATSIIEAIVVLLVITTGVTGMYTIFTRSTYLSTSTNNKIQAIQIAKQGIEAFTNIRDSNWIRFSSDNIDCWNTLNYNSNCLGQNNTTYDIPTGSYIIYRSTDNSWLLGSKTSGIYGAGTYTTDYRVGLNNGIYTQTGTLNNLFPVYTREIQISYLQLDGVTAGADSDEPKIKVKSLVQWVDSSSNTPHKIVFEEILSNWKK